MNELRDELRKIWKSGFLSQLIVINCSVFLIQSVFQLFLFLFNSKIDVGFLMREWFGLSNNLINFLYKPWTIITYMFLHDGIMHLLMNVVWLLWFGRLFLIYFNSRQLLSVYIQGSLLGGILYLISYNIFPGLVPNANANMVGASAAIMAIVLGVSMYKPDYIIPLLFIGNVKLKYLAFATIAIDVISIPYGNTGGHIAHLGGALFGYLFAKQMIVGKDISRRMGKFLDLLFTLFKPRPRLRVERNNAKWNRATIVDDMKYNKAKNDKQTEIDRILEKISKNGYNSLNSKEKEFLFQQKEK